MMIVSDIVTLQERGKNEDERGVTNEAGKSAAGPNEGGETDISLVVEATSEDEEKVLPLSTTKPAVA
ncbi:hypothetical protein G7Y89_g14093 [Cudoniella acicularis]|uniref:Uncharacterized protein n=1 Tax=Cudoniella acicularis TaxID=354080 RepID=A0A8H4R602_9HELO|nr:hypothetical protein G7Y89_g14093 [Cudoniella acicularis]